MSWCIGLSALAAADNSPVRPVLSAMSRVATLPAWATTPTPRRPRSTLHPAAPISRERSGLSGVYLPVVSRTTSLYFAWRKHVPNHPAYVRRGFRRNSHARKINAGGARINENQNSILPVWNMTNVALPPEWGLQASPRSARTIDLSVLLMPIRPRRDL